MDFSVSNLPIIIISIIISMGIHEAMHAFTSHWLGDSTAKDLGRLTLNPLKHIDIYTTVLLPVVLIVLGLPPIFIAKPVPFNPLRVKHEEYGIALIGLAGPVTNLLLALAAAGVLRIFGLPLDVAKAIVIFMQVNIGFFVFNMIPFPPLDGSRVLYAFAPDWLRKIMLQIESFGFMALIIFFLVLSPILSPIISFAANGIFDFLLRIALPV